MITNQIMHTWSKTWVIDFQEGVNEIILHPFSEKRDARFQRLAPTSPQSKIALNADDHG